MSSRSTGGTRSRGQRRAVPLLLVDGDAVTSDAAGLGRREGHRRGPGRDQGSEDPDRQVQEQDRLPQAAGSSPAVHPGQGHRDRELGSLRWHTRRARPRPATVGTPTPSDWREAVRRSAGQRRRDHRPPARHPLPPRRRRRPRWRRHPVRPGRGQGRVRHQPRSPGREHPAGRGPPRPRSTPPVARPDQHLPTEGGPDLGHPLSCFTRERGEPVAIPSFVDRVTLHVYGGNGGNGCASVHREKFKPLGGPDGGNGGNGGSVILRVDPGLTTLVDYHRQSHRRATTACRASGDHANGSNGETSCSPSPTAPSSPTPRPARRLADLTGDGAELVVAQVAEGARQCGSGFVAPQGSRLRPARRGGRDPYGHPRAQGRRRRRVGRLSQRRQVVAGRGHLPRPAQDRRLPVHHADPEPGCGRRRGRHLHRRGRTRSDRGRQRGPGTRPRLPAPHRALRGDRARDRLRHLRAGS